MPRQKIPHIILCVCFLAMFAPKISAQTTDSGTYWLMVDVTADARASSLLKSLSNLLTKKGKVPQQHIHRLEGEAATHDEIHSTLVEIGSNLNEKETLIFLFHGEVSKQRGGNAMYLSTQSEQTIRDSVVNQWFKEAGIVRPLVIIDGYASDENLGIYYANRETLGTAALNIIQPAEITDVTGKNSFLKALIDALTEEKTDTDGNRHISIIEVYQQLQTNNSFERAILAPTDNVEATILKLSPAIKVNTSPEGAQISLNEKESGLTPKLFTENLQQGNYTVSVRKAGYISPLPKTTELKLAQGEVINFSWALKPISVFGTVTAPTDVSVVDTQVSIDGTEYVGLVGEDGTYSFQDWKVESPLTPGKEYTLYAKQGELYQGSATFTFEGDTAIEQPIELIKKTWFEIAELEFSRNNHQKAVKAFEKGIQSTTDFPPMSEDFTVLLLSAFADAIKHSEVQDVNYIVVTAKLAEANQGPELAKKYWQQVKLKAEKGSDAAKLAGQRLWQMNPWRNIINIGIVVLLVAVLISGAWTFYRYRKTKQIESDA